jgi:hypothetical protein
VSALEHHRDPCPTLRRHSGTLAQANVLALTQGMGYRSSLMLGIAALVLWAVS